MTDGKLGSRVRLARSTRCRLITALLVASLLLLPLWRFEALSLVSIPNISITTQTSQTSHSPDLEAIQERRKNVVIASSFGYHFDVYLAVAWTLKRVMREGSLRLYTPWPYYFDFQKIIDGYGLYDGEYHSHENLTRDVLANGGDGGIDLIIFGTSRGPDSMKRWSEDLLRAWDERDVDHKFEVVCIVHDALDSNWQSSIPEWSRRNAIRLLPISAHVGKAFRDSFRTQARSADPAVNSAGLEYVPIDFHIPILDVINLPDLPPNRMLANAVIQGSFDSNRRDYTRILSELNTSVHANPEAWGYLPLTSGRQTFIPDRRSSQQEFKLHLVGSGWLSVPSEIRNLIVFHTNLNYTDYYSVMGGMDICIPAFLARENKNFKFQASSSIAMCMETNVPILALQELRDAYTHIDDDRITITRPAIMSEVQALKALRTGDATSFLFMDPASSGIPLGANSRVQEAVEQLLRSGWIREKGAFEICKNETWKKNELVMLRILRDMW